MSNLELLRGHDPALVELETGHGAVLLSPGLQGRIFCHIGGELIHRLDAERLERPSEEGFNNLGGNSLWPAPEGGDFAFNYPPNSSEWRVQEGIAEVNPRVTHREETGAVAEKTVTLTNRKGVDIRLVMRRNVVVADVPLQAAEYNLAGVAYESEDTFLPCGQWKTEGVLIAPWSLDQFPGAEGVVAFGKVDRPEEAINFDFYGDPRARITYSGRFFAFALGGEDRHQIGIAVANNPECIGALDPGRRLLILRESPKQAGTYFNIADNDQPNGPFSAADLYSIFNGGDLNFFELETIAPMQIDKGVVAPSSLVSRTSILRGETESLERYLAAEVGLQLTPGTSGPTLVACAT